MRAYTRGDTDTLPRSLRVIICTGHSVVHQAVPARFANCPSILIRLFIFKPPVVTPIVVTPGLFKTGGGGSCEVEALQYLLNSTVA